MNSFKTIPVRCPKYHAKAVEALAKIEQDAKRVAKIKWR